jgi:hypothetical protein
MRKSLCALLVLTVYACGSSTPTTPVGPDSSAGPVVLVGSVTWPGGAVPGATIKFLDGPNVKWSTTSGPDGNFRLIGLMAGNANLSATATGFEERRTGIELVPGDNLVTFHTRTIAPWRERGTGDTVFSMPTYITSVRIQASAGACRNFIVHIGGYLVVNTILGTCPEAAGETFDATFGTNGGVTQTVNSSGVSWTFTETR